MKKEQRRRRPHGFKLSLNQLFNYAFTKNKITDENGTGTIADKMTYSRAGETLMLNLAGEYVSFGNNVPAVTGLGLKGSPEVINLVEGSNTFEDARWGKFSGLTVNDNAALAPDGTMTACRVSGFDAVAGTRLRQIHYDDTIALKDFIGHMSFRAETPADVGKTVRFQIKRVSGVGVYTYIFVVLTLDWQRIELPITFLADSEDIAIELLLPLTDGASSFLIWVAQIETGNYTHDPIVSPVGLTASSGAIQTWHGIAEQNLNQYTFVIEWDYKNWELDNRRVFVFDGADKEIRLYMPDEDKLYLYYSDTSGGVWSVTTLDVEKGVNKLALVINDSVADIFLNAVATTNIDFGASISAGDFDKLWFTSTGISSLLTANVKQAASYSVAKDAAWCLDTTKPDELNVDQSKLIAVWGDSQSDALRKQFDAADVNGRAIGGDKSTHILDRVIGYLPELDEVVWATGGVELRARRMLPARTVDEEYRDKWEHYGKTIHEPDYLTFYNDGAVIGATNKRYKTHAYIDGGSRMTPVGDHVFVNGDQVIVKDVTRPDNMYAWKTYFVRNVNLVDNYFKLSEFDGETAISFTGFKGYVEVLGDFYMDWDYDGGSHNITTSSKSKADANIHHFCAGTNNITEVEQIKSDIAKMAELHGNDRFVISVIPGFYGSGGSWNIGGYKHDDMLEVNAWILATYPNNSIDIYTYLLTQGDGSANDIADIALGLVPRSLRVALDNGHLNTDGHELWKVQIDLFVANKGW